MNISVIMPSYRPGGLDITFDALKKQTFKGDWEFLFADELFDKRHMAFDEFSKQFPQINSKHVKAANYPYPCPASSSNSAIKVAQGELLVFIGDYSWFNPEFLQEHWDVYKSHEDTTVAASYIDLQMPVMKENPLIQDISVFPPDWNIDKFLGGSIVHLDDRHKYIHHWIDAMRGYLQENWIMGLISLPRKTIIRLNGYNTIYNGGKGGSDYDLNFRASRIGQRFLYSRNAVVYRCAHPHHNLIYPFTEKKHMRPRAANRKIQELLFADIHKQRKTIDGIIGLQDRNWKNGRSIVINGGGASGWMMKSIQPLLDHNLRVKLLYPGLDYSLSDYVTYGCSLGDVNLTAAMIDKAQCWFWWTGTDTYNLINHKWGMEPDNEFFHHPNLHHLAVHKRLQDELKSVGIESTVLLDVPDDSPFSLEKLPPLPDKCRILCYVPSSRPEFYGLPTILEVAKRVPDVDFVIYGNTEKYNIKMKNVLELGWINDVNTIYKDMTAMLRPSVHDGIPYSAVEMMRMGRYFISNYPYEGAFVAETVDEMVATVKRIKDIKKPAYGIAQEIREMYNTISYYNKFVRIFYGTITDEVD